MNSDGEGKLNESFVLSDSSTFDYPCEVGSRDETSVFLLLSLLFLLVVSVIFPHFLRDVFYHFSNY